MGTMPADRAILFRLATSTRLERAARAAPMGERLAWRAASRYVAGTTAAAAARVARKLGERGAGSSIDQYGELVQDTATAGRAATSYLGLADQVNALPADTWLSIDLSHLGLDIDPPGCADRLAAIAARLSAGRRIQVGAEDHSRADAVLACIETVARQGLASRLGATAQANFRRTPRDLERLVEAGVHVRLVKGAYVEPHDRALPFGEPTDIAYLRLAHRLAETQAQFALATHDGVLREAVLAALGPRPVEQLLGVRPAILDELVARGVPVRVYVPFGNDWFRYWMRRLAESRGA
jgi:proline dehydrogenase